LSIADFSGYAFCRAHSTAYGVEAYQSARLKKYFPAGFMAGVLLTNGKCLYDPWFMCWNIIGSASSCRRRTGMSRGLPLCRMAIQFAFR